MAPARSEAQNILLLTDGGEHGLRLWMRVGGTNPGFCLQRGTRVATEEVWFIKATRAWRAEREQAKARAKSEHPTMVEPEAVAAVAIAGTLNPKPLTRDRQAVLDRWYGDGRELVYGEQPSQRREVQRSTAPMTPAERAAHRAQRRAEVEALVARQRTAGGRVPASDEI